MHEDDLYGPPTAEDDAWYQHHVVSKGYPRVKRDKPMSGQTSFADVVASRVDHPPIIVNPTFDEAIENLRGPDDA